MTYDRRTAASEISLRKAVIRLARARPELRRHLLPLIKKAARTVRVDYEPGPTGALSLDGKTYPRASDLVNAVERVLKRDPKTIIMGPGMSVGPNQTADPYSDAPYALRNRKGDIKDTAYDPVRLWEDHWDKVLAWGRYERLRR